MVATRTGLVASGGDVGGLPLWTGSRRAATIEYDALPEAGMYYLWRRPFNIGDLDGNGAWEVLMPLGIYCEGGVEARDGATS